MNSISSSVSSIFSSSVISSTESLSREAPAKKKQLVRQARLDQGLSSTISGLPYRWQVEMRLEEEMRLEPWGVVFGGKV